VHWFRLVDGAIAEHDAVRDDLGMATQVGWIPPTPAFIVRMLLARRRGRSASRISPHESDLASAVDGQGDRFVPTSGPLWPFACSPRRAWRH
jgi:hypothetical protein